ncbi:MAG: hypothetical protein J6Y78_00310 [Paludibacteraceae bacterium]|nr:hypothetical protein [Paludibacteraceae bacterium]
MPHSLRARLSGLRYKKIISDKDYDRLCKALDNENVLDKIKDEINELSSYVAKFNGGDFAIHIDKEKVFEIIDKYRKGE